MTLVVAPCAVCEATHFEPVYPGTVGTDEKETDPGRYFSSSRTVARYLPIVRCVGCGLVMTNPRDSDDVLAQVYAVLEDQRYDSDDFHRIRSADRALGLVASVVNSPGQLLDLGCATGTFVRCAQKAGWNVTGIDASAWAIATARARCTAGTFQVGWLGDVRFAPATFDVITLWDVLEHLSSPLDALRRVRGWLRPGGWLLLSVPNVESAMARALGRRWVLLLREHLWYFSPRTMGELLERAGFELVRTCPKQVVFSLATILRRLAQYRGPASPMAAALGRIAAFERVAYSFPIGEMYVIARRREERGTRGSSP